LQSSNTKNPEAHQPFSGRAVSASNGGLLLLMRSAERKLGVCERLLSIS
jgi:hypothetical protein